MKNFYLSGKVHFLSCVGEFHSFVVGGCCSQGLQLKFHEQPKKGNYTVSIHRYDSSINGTQAPFPFRFIPIFKVANFFSLVYQKAHFFIHTQKRDSSYDFSNDVAMKRMRDNNKDCDFVTESPFSQSSPLSRVEESPNHGILTPREVRVSFNENPVDNGSQFAAGLI
ncbi:hypothetical protein H5410_061534 [Solanum commersonii]|uniref:Uncharacterized protein n=1 Tax=Solanum commersonii TaxID=4109 RepID=A0A9J5W9H1_SOLCO|nr:hypothetical protein H5410_061534 [Solanum commersonii]